MAPNEALKLVVNPKDYIIRLIITIIVLNVEIIGESRNGEHRQPDIVINHYNNLV